MRTKVESPSKARKPQQANRQSRISGLTSVVALLICAAALQSCATQRSSERPQATKPHRERALSSKQAATVDADDVAHPPQAAPESAQEKVRRLVGEEAWNKPWGVPSSELPDAGTESKPPASAIADAATTVRDVPWLSATLEFGESEGAGFARGPVTFANGSYEQLDEAGICTLCINILQVSIGDLTGDGKEEAVLLISSSTGGAATMLWGYVFQVADGLPRLLADIEGGDRGEGGIESVAVRKDFVQVRRFALGADDGTCCPSEITSERWKWIDGAMRQQGEAKVIKHRGKKPWRDAFRGKAAPR
jgi:hypothetical protein